VVDSSRIGPPVVGKRARRVADTRARLIDVALDLYVEQGFVATTIDEIAANASIGRSSFFRYFTSKEAVLFAPMLAAQEWFLDEPRARPSGEPPLLSVAAVSVRGDWPQVRRKDLSRVRKTMRSAPALRDALTAQLSSTFAPRLVTGLREMAPDLDRLAVKTIADTAINWCDWAIAAHVRDGGPLAAHFTDAIGATAALAGELADILDELTPVGSGP
jgi:AcrR family transcriptional regulator